MNMSPVMIPTLSAKRQDERKGIMAYVRKYKENNVLEEARIRIAQTFDDFERLYVSFSGGKDSTVMLHLVMDEARKRERKVGVLIIDLEAQYRATIEHIHHCLKMYQDVIEPFWVCLPLSLRNAVSNYQPQWICWDIEVKDKWVRSLPKGVISDENFFPFFWKGMEFEDFTPAFGDWYADGKLCACLVGIRTDESLNRYRTIANNRKQSFCNRRYTTRVQQNLYNVYPIYDWAVSDIWLYHQQDSDRPYNSLYDCMYRAGLTPAQMRICQPYGDDQRRGLWLYHILEPDTWYKVVERVNGANSGAVYAQESGNITGRYKITKPNNHTWKSFCDLLLESMPKKTRDHYTKKFQTFLGWWAKHGHPDGIPDEAPRKLENAKKAPSYRRLCKTILRNDYWCKGLSFAPPKHGAYSKFLKVKKIMEEAKRLEKV